MFSRIEEECVIEAIQKKLVEEWNQATAVI
jgi:hypothetical protein